MHEVIGYADVEILPRTGQPVGIPIEFEQGSGQHLCAKQGVKEGKDRPIQGLIVGSSPDFSPGWKQKDCPSRRKCVKQTIYGELTEQSHENTV